jgi:hypothetical protein
MSLEIMVLEVAGLKVEKRIGGRMELLMDREMIMTEKNPF